MTTTAPPTQLPTVELLQLIEDLDRTSDAELQAVARLAASVLGAPFASVNAVQGTRTHQLAAAGAPVGPPRADTVCARVRRMTDGAYTCTDLSAEPAFADLPWINGEVARLRGYASTPLVVGGAVVGALCVLDVVPRAFTAEQCTALDDLALLAGAALERRAQARTAARLASDVEQARQELEWTVGALASAHAELRTAQAFTDGLLEVLPVGVVAVDADGRRVLVNGVTRSWHDAADGGTATVASAPTGTFLHPDGVTPMAREELPLVRSLTGSGIASSEAVLVHPGRPQRWLSITSSPIHAADGTLLGSVAAMTDVTHQRELEDRLRAAALHDPLTGLPNRALLVDRLEHALRAGRRSGEPVTVLFCDLDGFKAVNDTHGHAAGDQVLAEVARRLSAAVRPGDTVARLGGDEFVLLCPGAQTAEAAAAIATRVEHALREPVRLAGGATARVGVSVGVAVSGVAVPGADERPEDLLTRADEGMYAVKQRHHAATAR